MTTIARTGGPALTTTVRVCANERAWAEVRRRGARTGAEMQRVLLSHILRPGGPVYPGEPTLVVERRSDMDAGGHSNTAVLHLFNHFGTHVDGPRHFNARGLPLAVLPVEAFVFSCVALVDVRKWDNELIGAEELRAALPRAWLCDLLLLRTGFGEVREGDPERYVSRSPGLAAEAARMVVEELGTVRAIGLDTISVGAPAQREEGRETHRVLCGDGRTDGRFVLIYEDVNLAPLEESPVRVWGLPLLVEGLDSAPATLVAEV